FDRIHLFEDPKTPEELPRRTALQRLPPNALGFRQTLPYNPPPITEPHPKDRAFAIAVQTSATLETATWPSAETGRREPQEFERRMRGDEPFVAVVQLEHGTATSIPDRLELPSPSAASYRAAWEVTQEAWAEYWRQSAIQLSAGDSDEAKFLEKIWYWNHYFYNAAIRPES